MTAPTIKTTLMETVKTKLVTPDEAKKWLEKNSNNRHLSNRIVDFYTSQMRTGSWHLTGDTVKFDPDGNLLDGQHRLYAVIAYGKPVMMMIAYNIAKEAFNVLDTGKVRSAGDVLSIKDFGRPTSLASAIRQILLFQKGAFGEKNSKASGITNAQILDFAEKNQALSEVVTYCSGVHKQFRALSTPNLVMLYHVLSKKSVSDADKFFEGYGLGIDLGVTSPIRLLRDRLLRDMTNKTKLSGRDKMALFIYAWNAYRLGERKAQLTLQNNYHFPIPK